MDLQVLSKSKLHVYKNCAMYRALTQEMREYVHGSKKDQVKSWGKDIQDAFTKQLRRLPGCEASDCGIIIYQAKSKAPILKLSDLREDVVVILTLGLIDPDSKQHTFVNTSLTNTKQVFRALFKFNPSEPVPPLVTSRAFEEKGDTLKGRKQYEQTSSELTPLSELIFEPTVQNSDGEGDDVKSDEKAEPPKRAPVAAAGRGPSPFRQKGDTLKGRRKVGDVEAEPLGMLSEKMFRRPGGSNMSEIATDDLKQQLEDDIVAPIPSFGASRPSRDSVPSFGSADMVPDNRDKVSSMPIFPSKTDNRKAFNQRGDTLKNLRNAKGPLKMAFKPLTGIPVAEGLKETETVETVSSPDQLEDVAFMDV